MASIKPEESVKKPKYHTQIKLLQDDLELYNSSIDNAAKAFTEITDLLGELKFKNLDGKINILIDTIIKVKESDEKYKQKYDKLSEQRSNPVIDKVLNIEQTFYQRRTELWELLKKNELPLIIKLLRNTGYKKDTEKLIRTCPELRSQLEFSKAVDDATNAIF